VNEQILTYWGLSHQIKYIVGQSGRSLAEIVGSNTNEIWTSVSSRADHTSRVVVVCEGGLEPQGLSRQIKYNVEIRRASRRERVACSA
jgi:hypothetical protein